MRYIENPISEAVTAYRIKHENREQVRRFLIQYLTETIMLEYDYKEDLAYIDPFYHDYIGFKISGNNAKDFVWLDSAVYRPHIQDVRDFINLSDVKSTVSRLITVKLLAASGDYEWFRLNLICYADSLGNKDFLVITATNVEHEMTAIKELEFLAESDPLTRIPNRDTFFKKTKENYLSNKDTRYVLIRCDVEHFSTINQLFGSNEGDNLLKYIAVKLQEYIEADGNGTYCRLESDAFGLCIQYTPEALTELEAYMQEVFALYPIKFELQMSFGYYVINDISIPIETMFDHAFAAQKTIKGSVIQHSAYYGDELERKELVEQRISNEMRSALKDNQFHVYLQPKCDMKTGEIVGSEELVRWIHPEFGVIPPNDFIPLFERNGFISELDQYILEQCCRIIRGWMDNGMKILPISVNISRTDLYDPKLFNSILQTVDSYHIPHSAIEFELTESSFIADTVPLTNLNNNLRAHGFKVLMDDFGSGYSSLNSLKELAVDILKIDLKFIPASRSDTRACAIISAVVKMADSLGLAVVAEGVETQQQAELLLEIGCHTAQGYHFHRPMPVNNYESIIKNICLEEHIQNGRININC